MSKGQSVVAVLVVSKTPVVISAVVAMISVSMVLVEKQISAVYNEFLLILSIAYHSHTSCTYRHGRGRGYEGLH